MGITYKLDPSVRVIQSPVTLKTTDTETAYENGSVLAAASLEKRYVVDSVTAEGGRIIICVSENTGTKEAGWADRKVSLFDGD